MFLDTFLTSLSYIIVFLLLFGVAKFSFARFNGKFDLKEELVEKDNPCVAVMLGGYLFGVMLVMKGVMSGASHGLVADLTDQVLYGFLGLILLSASPMVNDRLLLPKFSIIDEIVKDRNLGVAAVVAGSFIATGFVVGGALSGEGGGLDTALLFWLFGQLALLLSVFIYGKVVPYDIHAQLEADNVAVGVALSGAIIALGIIVGGAVSGDFESWSESGTLFVEYVVIGLVLLPFTRLIVDKVLLPSVSLADEIVHQSVPNVGAAFLEGMSYCIAALLVVSTLL